MATGSEDTDNESIGRGLSRRELLGGAAGVASLGLLGYGLASNEPAAPGGGLVAREAAGGHSGHAVRPAARRGRPGR